MLIEAARRAETAVKEMLALINEGSASCAEARKALAISKAISTVNSAFQTGAAAVIAKVERHGDGGTQILADAAGLSRREAHSQVKTAQAIEAVPSVRDAVESGRVSIANAKRLAEAVEKTSVADVESDAELLAKAESMRPEQFTKEARHWAADRQSDGGEADYRHLRAKRYVRIWDSDDGTVELHGKFDPVAGRRIGNRLQAEARRLYDADKKQAGATGDAQRRSFQQCMADALDDLTGNTASGNGKPFADICVVAHVDEDTGKFIAELPDGARLPQAVLEELACNAKFTGIVYDRQGKPIWRVHSVRTATEAQRQILIALYGGCCVPLRSKPGHRPDPPHRTSLTGRNHQYRQYGPGLLGLPPQNPLRRLADPQAPRRPAHAPPTRPYSLRTRSCARPSAAAQIRGRAGSRSSAAARTRH